MKKVALVFLALTAVACIQSCQSTKSVTSSRMLKFNFEKGKGYDYEMIINTDQEDGGVTRQMDMTAYYSMDVTEDDGNMKTITTSYDRFKMNVDFGGMNIDVDSDKPMPSLGTAKQDPLKMLNSLFGAIKGRKFVMKVNAEGKIESVEGFKEMTASIVDSMHLEEAQRQVMITQLSKQFNDQNIKDQFERVLYIFPNKKVKVGDSWEKITNPRGPMGGQYTSAYTVSEIEGDMVTVEEKTKVAGITAGEGLKGEITGTLVVDSRTGLVVNADQDMDFTTTSKAGKTTTIKGKTKLKGKAR